MPGAAPWRPFRALPALLLAPVLVLALAGAGKRREVFGPPMPPPPPTPYDLCEAAVAQAKPPTMPPTLMPAISRVESGRTDPDRKRVRPWPWTINVEGAGFFFETKAEAIAAVEANRAKGVKSIDVGCMQVNLMHHATAFPDLETAFDPEANARYAARFLLALYGQTKDWSLATGMYHSAEQVRGEDYQRRVFGRVMTPMGPPRDGKALNLAAPNAALFGAIPAPSSMFGAIPPPSLIFGTIGPASPPAAAAKKR